jgi:mRNA interferase MazF
VNRGEVWWVERPDIGRRPHLVLTRQGALAVLNEILAVPATRTERGIPTEVALGQADGMPETCVLTLDSVTAVPRVFFRERICTLRPDRMWAVCEALRVATGCP